MTQKLYRVLELCDSYGISPETFRKEVKAGRLKVLKSGKRTLIDHDEAQRWWSERFHMYQYQPPRQSSKKSAARRKKPFSLNRFFKRLFRKQK